MTTLLLILVVACIAFIAGAYFAPKIRFRPGNKAIGKTDASGFMFDPAIVGTIPDDKWLSLKDDPDAVRRYIDQRAHNSQELVALRNGVIAARNKSLMYYSEGNDYMGDAMKRDARNLENKADQLERTGTF